MHQPRAVVLQYISWRLAEGLRKRRSAPRSGPRVAWERLLHCIQFDATQRYRWFCGIMNLLPKLQRTRWALIIVCNYIRVFLRAKYCSIFKVFKYFKPLRIALTLHEDDQLLSTVASVDGYYCDAWWSEDWQLEPCSRWQTMTWYFQVHTSLTNHDSRCNIKRLTGISQTAQKAFQIVKTY